MKTVAIVGSHTRTRGEAPWENQGIPVWVFNEAGMAGWPKRVDAVFQLHNRAVVFNPNNRNEKNYPEWLRQPHPFPCPRLPGRTCAPGPPSV
mgnify:CR=1 FL=1